MAYAKELNKIIANCYKIFHTRFSNRCSDSDWSNVFNAISMLKHIPEINEIIYSSGKYYNYFQFDGDKTPYREYELTIDTKYGRILGTIICCAAGSQDDPFKTYDMILNLWKDDQTNMIDESLNESVIMNESFNIQQVIQELKSSKSFEDIKQVVKRNIRGGILAGTILSMVLVNFTLSNKQAEDIKQVAYDAQIECIEDEIGEETYAEPEPKWQLIADDVETTVYNASKQQCNSEPSKTASGFIINMRSPESHRLIAMERTMMAKFGLHYGDLVLVKGTNGRDGVYQIQDTMNKRFKGLHKIDILINSDSQRGKWEGIEVYKLQNPEEVYDTLKDEMAPAKNQKFLDSYQRNYDKPITEAFNSRLIQFDDDDDMVFSKRDTSLSNITKQSEKKMIDMVIKETLINNYDPSYDGRYIIEYNEIDTIGYPIREKYNIYDVHSEGIPLLGVEESIPGKGVRAQNKREKNKKARIATKVSSDFTRILLSIDDPQPHVHICIHTKWWSCKYLTISKPILDFIANCPFPIRSIGIYNGDTGNIKEKDGDIVLNKLETDVTFFFTKNWKGQNFYLPKYPKPNDKFDPSVVLTQNMINNFPEKISSAALFSNPIPIYMAMVDHNIQSYVKVIRPFINAGYVVQDEFKNIYNASNFDEVAQQVADTDFDDIQDQKQQKVQMFLEKTLGDDLQVFDELLTKKSGRHLYLRTLYKYNRKQKNIYKKFQLEVIKDFLKDNNIDIDALIEESYQKTYDVYKTYDTDKIYDFNIDNKINFANSIFNNLVPFELYQENDKIDFYARRYIPAGVYIGDKDCYNEYVKQTMIERFLYKFEQKIYLENPNGWNKQEPSIDHVYNKICEEDYYANTIYHWADFGDSSLALDDHNDLMFLFYALGYALKNAYSQDMFGFTPDAKKAFMDANEEPILNNINFSAIAKCLNTVFADMKAKGKF